MKFSTRSRYGLRAILDIAINGKDKPASINAIAERQDISEKYLEQLMPKLKKAGFIESVRGTYGGYVLAKSPEDISVGEVLRVLEGPLAPVRCIVEKEDKRCGRWNKCVTKFIWAEIKDKIEEAVDSITLKTLVEIYKKKDAEKGYMYYI